MKKVLICALVFGITTVVTYWSYKKERVDKEVSNPFVTNEVDSKCKIQEEQKQEDMKVSDLSRAKSDCVQNIYERHTAVGKEMKNAYSNIMEDFVEDHSNGDTTSAKEKDNKTIIDSEAVNVIKKQDSLSEDLDVLLK